MNTLSEEAYFSSRNATTGIGLANEGTQLKAKGKIYELQMRRRNPSLGAAVARLCLAVNARSLLQGQRVARYPTAVSLARDSGVRWNHIKRTIEEAKKIRCLDFTANGRRLELWPLPEGPDHKWIQNDSDILDHVQTLNQNPLLLPEAPGLDDAMRETIQDNAPPESHHESHHGGEIEGTESHHESHHGGEIEGTESHHESHHGGEIGRTESHHESHHGGEIGRTESHHESHHGGEIAGLSSVVTGGTILPNVTSAPARGGEIQTTSQGFVATAFDVKEHLRRFREALSRNEEISDPSELAEEPGSTPLPRAREASLASLALLKKAQLAKSITRERFVPREPAEAIRERLAKLLIESGEWGRFHKQWLELVEREPGYVSELMSRCRTKASTIDPKKKGAWMARIARDDGKMRR